MPGTTACKTEGRPSAFIQVAPEGPGEAQGAIIRDREKPRGQNDGGAGEGIS